MLYLTIEHKNKNKEKHSLKEQIQMTEKDAYVLFTNIAYNNSWDFLSTYMYCTSKCFIYII